MSAAALSACAVGLQVSYLTWGVLQERLITLDFEGEKFESSLFLVFTNRAVAFCVALAIHFKIKGSGNRAPFYKYALLATHTHTPACRNGFCKVTPLHFNM